jgi:hypothetical protein
MRNLSYFLFKTLKINNPKIYVTYYQIQLIDIFHVFTAQFIAEYIRFRMIQTFSANSILNHLTYILQRKRGYKIIVKGRPFRTTRSKKICVKKG